MVATEFPAILPLEDVILCDLPNHVNVVWTINRAMNSNGWPGAYSKEEAKAQRSASLNMDQFALKGLKFEKLNQLTTGLLLGVRRKTDDCRLTIEFLLCFF